MNENEKYSLWRNQNLADNDLIDELNKRPDIHGILLQLPVPMHLNPQNLIERIDYWCRN